MKKFNKITLLIVLQSLFICIGPPAGQQDCRAASGKKIVLDVGIYHNPSSIFVDEEGRAKGLYAELLDEIAAKEGWELNYIFKIPGWPRPWSN